MDKKEIAEIQNTNVNMIELFKYFYHFKFFILFCSFLLLFVFTASNFNKPKELKLTFIFFEADILEFSELKNPLELNSDYKKIFLKHLISDQKLWKYSESSEKIYIDDYAPIYDTISINIPKDNPKFLEITTMGSRSELNKLNFEKLAQDYFTLVKKITDLEFNKKYTLIYNNSLNISKAAFFKAGKINLKDPFFLKSEEVDKPWDKKIPSYYKGYTLLNIEIAEIEKELLELNKKIFMPPAKLLKKTIISNIDYTRPVGAFLTGFFVAIMILLVKRSYVNLLKQSKSKK